MKRKRFTEEQIITILKEHEAGVRVQDLVRKHNVSEQSIYRWKSKSAATSQRGRAQTRLYNSSRLKILDISHLT